MGAPIFLGDEVTGCGFRLAGAIAKVVPPGQEASALEEARAEASVVLVSSSVASRIPGERLRAALRAVPPVTVVVPDLREGPAFADDSPRLKRQLGLDE
jgi:vacuolar-type H+-ATPase subunit F/Vma7